MERYKNSTAESFASLSIGLFSFSIITPEQWHDITLIILGTLCAVVALCSIIPLDMIRNRVSNSLGKKDLSILKIFGWFLVLATFAINLIQTGSTSLKIVGILFAIVAFIVLFIGIQRTNNVRN